MSVGIDGVVEVIADVVGGIAYGIGGSAGSRYRRGGRQGHGRAGENDGACR